MIPMMLSDEQKKKPSNISKTSIENGVQFVIMDMITTLMKGLRMSDLEATIMADTENIQNFNLSGLTPFTVSQFRRLAIVFT